MQLVALYLLQGDGNGNVDLPWQLPFYGLEFWSTHLVKCTIAASLTVRKEDRMAVGKLLKEKLALYPDPSVWKQLPAMVREQWDVLLRAKAVDCHEKEAHEDDRHTVFWPTVQQRAPSRIVTIEHGGRRLQTDRDIDQESGRHVSRQHAAQLVWSPQSQCGRRK